MTVLKFIHFTMWILAVVKKQIKGLCRPAFNSYDGSTIFDHTQTVVKARGMEAVLLRPSLANIKASI